MHAYAHLRRDEAGFTLIELLVAIALLVVVLGLVLSPMTTAANLEQSESNYNLAQQAASTGVESMVAQIRQATAISSSGPNSVLMNVTLAGSQLQVFYECDIAQAGTPYRECMRVSAPVGSALPPVAQGAIVVNNLQNGTITNPVFSWGPDPNAPYYMTATVVVPASDGKAVGMKHPIVFSDGALMRNLNVEN